MDGLALAFGFEKNWKYFFSAFGYRMSRIPFKWENMFYVG